MRRIVFWVMDHVCGEWNGHAFMCWNRPRWVNRIWHWAIDGDQWAAKVEFYYPREDMFSEFWLETPEYRDETSGNDR